MAVVPAMERTGANDNHPCTYNLAKVTDTRVVKVEVALHTYA